MLPRETVCNDMFVMTQAKTGIYGCRDVPVGYTMRQRNRLLLTGWSLVRIRPGEPNKINVARAARCQIAQQAAFGAAKAAGDTA